MAVHRLGLGPLLPWGGNPVLLTGQPELQVLLTELRLQEPEESFLANWEEGGRGHFNKSNYTLPRKRVSVIREEKEGEKERRGGERRGRKQKRDRDGEKRERE